MTTPTDSRSRPPSPEIRAPSLDLLRDLRHALAGLRRDAGTNAAAILILAIAIAATTCMVALTRGILLRPLPVRAQDRLIVSWKDLPASGYAHHPFGDREIDAAGRASRLLAAVAGVDANGAGRGLLIDGGTASYVKSAFVTGRFFEVLGVDPVLGRVFRAEDDLDGAERVVVISRGFWQRRYGASPDVIGRPIELEQRTFAIVGVVPDFDVPLGTELWRTTHSTSTDGPFGDAARREIDLVGRMAPGVTVDQVRSELSTLTRELERTAPAGSTRGFVPVVRPFADVIVGDVQRPILIAMIAVGLVLLIASANVANLLLMRGEGRRHELAVRAALGASTARLAAQLLAESVVLSLIAGAAGVTLAWWTLGSLLSVMPDDLPRLEAVRVDPLVILGVTVAVGLSSAGAGLVPVWFLARGDVAGSLRAGARGTVGTPANRARRALVVTQVALAVALVCTAGLLVRTLLRLQFIDTGYEADRLVVVELSLPQGKYGERARHAQFLDDAIAAVGSAPGVVSATPVNNAPFSGGWDVPRFIADGQSADRAARNPALNLESIFPNYFATLRIPIIRGRAFTEGDREGTQLVAIVSEDVAALTWPGEDPIGKRLKMGGPSREPWMTVVGVVAPTRYRTLAQAPPTIYLPAAQFLVTAEMLVLSTDAPFDGVAAATRARLAELDAGVRVVRITPFARLLDRPLAQPRFNASLLTAFGATAYLLAAVGLYAVIAAAVRQRAREIALRIAIGATAADLRRLVLGEAARLAGAGAVAGLIIAVAAARLAVSLLPDVEPLDAPPLFFAAASLLVAAVAAAWLPMQRAARADAVALLRN